MSPLRLSITPLTFQKLGIIKDPAEEQRKRDEELRGRLSQFLAPPEETPALQYDQPPTFGIPGGPMSPAATPGEEYAKTLQERLRNPQNVSDLLQAGVKPQNIVEFLQSVPANELPTVQKMLNEARMSYIQNGPESVPPYLQDLMASEFKTKQPEQPVTPKSADEATQLYLAGKIDEPTWRHFLEAFKTSYETLHPAKPEKPEKPDRPTAVQAESTVRQRVKDQIAELEAKETETISKDQWKSRGKPANFEPYKDDWYIGKNQQVTATLDSLRAIRDNPALMKQATDEYMRLWAEPGADAGKSEMLQLLRQYFPTYKADDPDLEKDYLFLQQQLESQAQGQNAVP